MKRKFQRIILRHKLATEPAKDYLVKYENTEGTLLKLVTTYTELTRLTQADKAQQYLVLVELKGSLAAAQLVAQLVNHVYPGTCTCQSIILNWSRLIRAAADVTSDTYEDKCRWVGLIADLVMQLDKSDVSQL